MKYQLALTSVIIVLFKIPPQWSLLLGIIWAISFNLPELITKKAKEWATKTLQLSVILTGASLNFYVVLSLGLKGLYLTFFSIIIILLMGHFLARLLKVPSPLSTLISVGTSICGGSAISAITSVLKPDTLTISTALGIVFILNGISIFIFTSIGQWMDLTQTQFGTWAALAIHDTSSVVAAAQIYGAKALETATTLKLTRALWIMPLALFYSYKNKSDQKAPVPWFILLFLIFSLSFTFIESLQAYKNYFQLVAKSGFALTLFFIGLTLNKQQLKQIQPNSLLMGVVLWLITSVLSLLLVRLYF